MNINVRPTGACPTGAGTTRAHPQVPPPSPTHTSHPQVPPTSPTHKSHPQEPPRPSFTNEFIMSSPEIYSDDVFDDVTSDAYKPPMTSNSVASVAGFLHEQAKAQEWTLEQQRREIAMLRQDEIALKERNNTLNAENKHLREENKKFRTNEQRSYNNDKSKWLSKSKPAGFGNEKRSADTERFIVKCIVPRIRNYKDAQAVLLYLNTRMATKRNSQAKPSTPATPIRLSRDHHYEPSRDYRDQASTSAASTPATAKKPTKTTKTTKPTKTTKTTKRPREHTPPRKKKQTRLYKSKKKPRALTPPRCTHYQEAQGYSSQDSDTEAQLSDPENIFSTVDLVSSSEEY